MVKIFSIIPCMQVWGLRANNGTLIMGHPKRPTQRHPSEKKLTRSNPKKNRISIHHPSDGYLCFHPPLVGCRLCIVGLISSVIVAHLYLYVTFNFQSVVIFVFCFSVCGQRIQMGHVDISVFSLRAWDLGLTGGPASAPAARTCVCCSCRPASRRPAWKKAGRCLVRSCSGTGRWRLPNGNRACSGVRGERCFFEI